jgi:hypothetical protein
LSILTFNHQHATILHVSDIHIVGLDHFLQNQQAFCLTAAGLESERQQKQQFERLLRDLLRDAHIDLIAEEATFDGSSLGCRLAQELRLRYVNITMPQDERDRLGLPIDYEDREESKLAALKAFERYMAEKVNEQHEAQAIMVLCGRLHVDSLRDAFEASGHAVKTGDVADYEWFRGIPIEGEGGVIGHHREP